MAEVWVNRRVVYLCIDFLVLSGRIDGVLWSHLTLFAWAFCEFLTLRGAIDLDRYLRSCDETWHDFSKSISYRLGLDELITTFHDVTMTSQSRYFEF